MISLGSSAAADSLATAILAESLKIVTCCGRGLFVFSGLRRETPGFD